jgi:hypothetical protein
MPAIGEQLQLSNALVQLRAILLSLHNLTTDKRPSAATFVRQRRRLRGRIHWGQNANDIPSQGDLHRVRIAASHVD